jgi:hypothetical protein
MNYQSLRKRVLSILALSNNFSQNLREKKSRHCRKVTSFDTTACSEISPLALRTTFLQTAVTMPGAI